MTKFAHDTVVPYDGSARSKKEQVEEMFDNIAGRYDFLNRFLSAGIDKGWRKKALLCLRDKNPQQMLDVATGTADVAIMALHLLKPAKVTGIDISEGMLAIGKNKVQKLGLQGKIELLKGDSETINFNDNTFDAVTVAFGVRNFQNLEKGLSEILRVLKPGGKLVVLEFSKPEKILMKTLYNTYMKNIAPAVSSVFSKNPRAYEYLGESIQKFPEGKNFVKIMDGTGYKNTSKKPLTLGICSIYCGEK
ncbi:MAG: bifunctional demethylmenaquinone methyltransferase/2-methoxy-6-polyprenyl-1,4-benzoquinol methylase UbiE [Ferruginibacter sp.]